MPLQYLTDASGIHTAVLIPINEWEMITHKHADLKSLESIPAKQKLSSFAGILSNEDYESLKTHTEQARKEWDRNF